MIKLKHNGALDGHFEIGGIFAYPAGTGVPYTVRLAIQSDNKVIVTGDFNQYDGVYKNRILRLNNLMYQNELVAFTTPSQIDSCNGTVYLSIAGIPNFTFDIGTGTTVTSGGYSQFDSLCAGVYSASVLDGNGDYFYSTFVVASDSSFLLNNPITNDPIVDSLVALVENCPINYPGISQIYIASSSMIGQDTMLVNWAVVDGSDTTIIQATYIFGSAGAYYLQLQLYCPQKTLENYFVITEGVFYNGSGLDELSITSFDEFSNTILYPNPNNGCFKISSEKQLDFQILNQMGQIVYTLNKYTSEDEINLSTLSRGIYSAHLRNKETGNFCIKQIIIY